MRLKNRDEGPPDNFRFTHSETRHVSRGNNWFDWRSEIMAHRKANNLDIPANMMDLAEDQLCAQLDPWHCEHTEGRTNVSTRFNFGDVVNGMKSLGKMMLGLVDFVPQAEADRRAKICAGCFYNVNADGCVSCKRVAELIKGEVAKKQTIWDASLKVCAVCRCANAAKVWFPLSEIPTDETEQAAFPDFCWQKQNGENFVPA